MSGKVFRGKKLDNDVIGIVEANISNTFGLIKDRKMSGQEFKDMLEKDEQIERYKFYGI